MGLEKIHQGIQEKAAAEEKKILDGAAATVADIRKKTSAAVKELEKKAQDDLAAQKSSLDKRNESIQRLAAQQTLFKAKKEVIDKVYASAFEKVKGMDKSSKKDILKKLLEKAAKEIEIATVFANKDDLALISGYETKEADIDGGIICETKDGSTRVSYTFADVFEEIQDKTMKEVSNIVFS